MKLLFVSENVTLAQVVRLFVLARGAALAGHDVHFACASFDERIFAGAPLSRWKIKSISRETVDARIASGGRIHELDELAAYVDEELRLMREVKPDLVIGDLRPSLSISAPLARVRQATLINAYWSPHAVRARFPLPDHPIVRAVGIERAEKYFPLAMPHVFAHFAKPVNALRRRHRLPEIGSLLEVMTHGDLVLHPDSPGLVPTRGAPRHHVHLGPIPWSPSDVAPFEHRAPRARPLVYATLGSSGKLDLVPIVLQAVDGLDVDVVLATAGRVQPTRVPSNVQVYDFVAGDRLAAAADVVISNGGSTTGYQALTEGTPVIGLPFNLDQYLATSAIVTAGAGLVVRSGSATPQAIRAAISAVLSLESFRVAARRVSHELARFEAVARFLEVIEGPRREEPAFAP